MPEEILYSLRSQVYKEYEAQMRANNALDFDDLLVKTVRFWKRSLM